MARKKKSAGGGGPGSGDWLNTYADMVTLLLTFFILLYSMSSLNAAKFNMLVTAFASDGESSEKIVIHGETTGDRQDAGQEFNENSDIDIDEIFDVLQRMIAEQGMEGSVTIEKGEGFVYILFPDDMFFEPNSSMLKPDSRAILDFIGMGIKSVQHITTSISIVGHTAAIPENPDYEVSDRLLSSARANEVLIYFEEVIGIDPEKLFSTGYGKWKPLKYADGAVEDNRTEESRAKNRRVEILIQNDDASLSQRLDNVYEKLVEHD